jgi:hypothetical protein
MATMISSNSLPELLSNNPVRNELITFLKELKHDCGTLSREQVVTILGQWFHPLHYFPTFLSRLISVTPDIETQTFISRILWQELGEGDPVMAHERVYIDTIVDGEFEQSLVAEAAPFEATQQLLDGYREASMNYLSGLGFLYGTEVADLPMVATIGELMRRCTGKRNLPWVNIHVGQEPHHVESSNETLKLSFTAKERREIIQSAEEMWRLWIGFFTSIRREILN